MVQRHVKIIDRSISFAILDIAEPEFTLWTNTDGVAKTILEPSWHGLCWISFKNIGQDIAEIPLPNNSTSGPLELLHYSFIESEAEPFPVANWSEDVTVDPDINFEDLWSGANLNNLLSYQTNLVDSVCVPNVIEGIIAVGEGEIATVPGNSGNAWFNPAGIGRQPRGRITVPAGYSVKYRIVAQNVNLILNEDIFLHIKLIADFKTL